MNLPAKINVAKAKLPATYIEAKKALAKCQRIDECKKWADKMAALASYGKQAGDMALFNSASEIKKRAIDRGGILLLQIEDKRGRPSKNRLPEQMNLGRMQAAKEAGWSRNQANTAIAVANIPRDEFEKHVGNSKESLKDFAKRGVKKPKPPLPYRIEYSEWTGSIRQLSQIPNCGLKVLAERIPIERPSLLKEAKTAAQNLERWIATLEQTK